MNDLLQWQKLKCSLAEWADWDVASYYIAIALGIAPDPSGKLDFWGGKKGVFWSANPLGEGLYQILEILVRSGILEKDEDELKFRWNSKFDWEKYGEK